MLSYITQAAECHSPRSGQTANAIKANRANMSSQPSLDEHMPPHAYESWNQDQGHFSPVAQSHRRTSTWSHANPRVSGQCLTLCLVGQPPAAAQRTIGLSLGIPLDFKSERTRQRQICCPMAQKHLEDIHLKPLLRTMCRTTLGSGLCLHLPLRRHTRWHIVSSAA